MRTEAPTVEAARHRVLEGVLLRLARLPNAGGLVVRGGMLLRHWFGATVRPTVDLDLVAPEPLTVAEATRRYVPSFSDPTIADGVSFEVDRLQVVPIWERSHNPGVRVLVQGERSQAPLEIQVDITGGPPPHPAAVWGELPTACGQTAHVWLCRPESVVGQKIQALHRLGVLGWRPKDLSDLWLLQDTSALDEELLRVATAGYLADLGGSLADAAKLFSSSGWWTMKRSSARWLDFCQTQRGSVVPHDLPAVVQQISSRLTPVWEGRL